MPNPICADCMKEMRCAKNEVTVRDADVDGFPATYWNGDRYECRECGAGVIVGFGKGRVPLPHKKPEAMQFRY